MYGLEDQEGLQLNENLEGQQNEGLSEAQLEYMKELQVPAAEWREMEPQEQAIRMNQIIDRFGELGLSAELTQIFEELYGPEMFEMYETLEQLNKVEAPNDIVQIEQVSDVLSECQELRFENWIRLTDDQKEAVMNQLEERIAEIECRPPCPVSFKEMEPDLWGGYRPAYKDIGLSDRLLDNTPEMYAELIDTLIHEGRHAYQDYNLHVQEVHPRHAEVESWRDTWGNGEGKWEYWNDCRTELGARLYDQQSIEIDARNFAGDVMNSLIEKLNNA